MNCRQCRFPLDSDALFCTNCGYKVVNNTTGEKTITAGRAADNTIIIDNPHVSLHHACFIISENKVLIEDLNSANNVYVNNKKIIISPVTKNDEIKFGSSYIFNWKELEKHTLGNHPYESDSTHKEAKSILRHNESVLTIGRSSENDIVINNIKVSRKHAKLEKINSVWYIEDLGSSNKTFLNGKRIDRSVVTANDLITIGGIPLNLNLLFETKLEIKGDVTLTAKNLMFSVGDKTIVDDLSLTIYPGEFVGLIGPSGAGKTSFMLMLNGVAKPTMGDVYINSESLYANYDSFKGLIGYVPQDDIIHRELTVEESLQFTAKLRFDTNYSESEIQSQVNYVINTLDLCEARNTLIGTAEKKGISGGQRKRVNLGQELLTEPSILFLDEPTSGLDPKTDMDVMNLLKKISEKGKIVVLTTHNITVENFNILTHLVVLTKGGKLAYFGPAREAVKYFNVSKPYEIFGKLNEKEASVWKAEYRNSSYNKVYVEERKKREGVSTTNRTEKRENRNTDFKQFATLVNRYLKIKLRDKTSTLILLLQAPIIAFLISIVFNSVEEKTQALFVLVIAAIWLGCSNAAREIVSEQSIYKRERMVNLNIPSYLFSKIFVLSILCLIQAAILSVITVPVLDLEINFIRLLLLLTATAISSLTIGLFISSIVNTNEAAMGLTPIVLIPQVILGGLISKFADMTSLIKVLSGFMISRWSFEASLIGEFGANKKYIINNIGFNENNLVTDFSMIILFSIVFFLLTAKVLKGKDV